MSSLVLQTGLFETAGSAELFLLARVLFGGVLAFMGLNHFMNGEDMAAYTEMKGIPAPSLLVGLTGGMLVAGGLAIVTGAFVLVGAGALAVFLLVSTPTMHDFWNVDDPQQQQTEMTQALKNFVALGGSLVFLALSGAAWPYAVSVGLF